MPNAKDITGGNSNVLVVGGPGSEKTRFLGTVPEIYIFDFDGGMASNRGRDIEYDVFKDVDRASGLATPQMHKHGLYSYGTAWDAFYAKLLSVRPKVFDGKVKALGFDSLTFMSMIAVNKILKDTGHESPHQGTWGAHHEYFKRIFSMVAAWPCRIFATAHVHRDENDLTKVTQKLPLLAGKLAGLIGAFFDDVYYMSSEGGKPLLLTKLTIQMEAKSRWNVPDKSPADWAQIAKYFPEKPL